MTILLQFRSRYPIFGADARKAHQTVGVRCAYI